MSDQPAYEANRRTVIRGGAIGAGALMGALGLGAGNAAAAPPVAVAHPETVEARTSSSASAVAAVVGTAGRVFLKLAGIAGESILKGFEGWIELTDFSWGAQNSGSAISTVLGKTTPLDVSFTAPTSKATPLLLQRAVTATHITTGQVVVAQLTATVPIQFVKIDLTDITVDYLKIDTPSAGLPMDRGSLTFAKVRFAYYPINASGALGTPVVVDWDLKTNKA
jgi:type VI secretion system secreted protein Hcp